MYNVGIASSKQADKHTGIITIRVRKLRPISQCACFLSQVVTDVSCGVFLLSSSCCLAYSITVPCRFDVSVLGAVPVYFSWDNFALFCTTLSTLLVLCLLVFCISFTFNKALLLSCIYACVIFVQCLGLTASHTPDSC